MKPFETTPIDRALLMAFEAQEKTIIELKLELKSILDANSQMYQRASNAEFELKAAVEKYEKEMRENKTIRVDHALVLEARDKFLQRLQSELKSARHSIAVMKGRRKNK